MYKLLLVSDQKDVLEAYDQIHNWEYNGFRRPSVRNDLEGAKEGLQKHHADGIILALSRRKKRKPDRFPAAGDIPCCPSSRRGRRPPRRWSIWASFSRC